MKFPSIFIACAAMSVISAQAQTSDNPFLSPYPDKYEIPPFEQIQPAHYLPALEAGIAEQNAAIKAITDNADAPTFDNTILALENSSPTLEKVAYVFFALTESNASPELDKISETFVPLYSKHSDEIMMNDDLFRRVKAVYDHRDKLEPDQKRLVDRYYKNFTRAGALLDPEKKEELKEINTELANLYLKFNKNPCRPPTSFRLWSTTRPV